jgi:hypothetical protein
VLHTAVYYNGAVGANVTDFDLAAITDQSITISNGHYIFMVPIKVIGAYGLGTSLTRVKLQTPKTRARANPYIRPFDRAIVVPDRAHYADLKACPIALNPIDETQVLVSNNLGAATEIETVAIWVDDGNTQHQQGDTFTVRATTVVAPAAGVWTAGTITFDQVLPAGRYSVIGMEAIGGNIMVARLVFPGQSWRPGVIGSPTAISGYPGDYFRHGYLGEFGQFESIAQPQIEILSVGAQANPDIYLDLIKVR